MILAGMLRKRSRAVLMLLQMVSAFLLFGLLQGFNGTIRQLIANAHADRLIVASAVTIGDPLPISLLAQLEAMPGVETALVVQHDDSGAPEHLAVIAKDA